MTIVMMVYSLVCMMVGKMVVTMVEMTVETWGTENTLLVTYF